MATYGAVGVKYGQTGGTYGDLDGDTPPEPTPGDEYTGRGGILGRRPPRPLQRPTPPPVRPPAPVYRRQRVTLTLVVTQRFRVVAAPQQETLALRAESQPNGTYRTLKHTTLRLRRRDVHAARHTPQSTATQIALEDEDLLVLAAELLLTPGATT